MTRLIVVPLDGSGFAEDALAIAASLAADTRGWLNLVTVHRPMLPIPTPDMDLEVGVTADAEIRAAELAYLAREADRVAAAFGVTVTPALLEGPVARTLKEYVESRRANLVVMSTHGRGGVSRFFLGSIADRLIRALHCPILLVRPGRGSSTIRHDHTTRVAVPLDGSVSAESAIDQLLALLRPEEVVIELVRVLQPPAAPPLAWRPVRRSTFTHDRLVANRYLAGVARSLRREGHRVHTEVLVAGNEASAIVAFAERRRCDLIGLATRGIGGFERAMLGSVADKVIRGATTPVLVWNPPGQPSSPAFHQVPAAAAALVPL
jgi:nucleotide-binding universal stress UspA family protein